MKIERTKNAGRNFLFGFIQKAYQILVPFLMRTVMIYCLGVEYLGLNSLFASILQVLNLAELGVGSAMVYSMYKPIAEDDETTICALMRLYRTYYRVIGIIIAAVGVMLTPFITRFIKSDLPGNLNVYVLYLLNLSATVLSYWLFAYKNCLLQAHQRVDITSKVVLVTNTVQYGSQIVVLLTLKNYYIYAIIALVTQALTNIVTALVVTKMYPRYRPTGKLPKEKVGEINGRIRDLFTSKIGGIIYDSADTIVISSFLGLTALAIYQNYFYILNAITGLIAVVFSACTAGIGNSIVVETKEKNFKDLNKFTFIICWGAGFCTVCLLCLYQPFMELWVGRDLMLSFSAVVCFAVYFFVRQLNSLFNMYKDASGMWHEDRFRPLVAALTNLALNLILVQLIGLYGILISTVLAIVCVGMPWLLHNLFTVIFEKKHLLGYLKKLLYYCCIIFVSCIATYFICSKVNAGLIVTLVARGAICVILPNLIYLLAYYKRIEFTDSLLLVNKMTKGKLRGILTKLGMRE